MNEESGAEVYSYFQNDLNDYKSSDWIESPFQHLLAG